MRRSLASAAFLFAGACVSRPPVVPTEVAFAPRAERSILICLDGIREDVFYEEVEAGHLPTFGFLLAHGSRFDRAVTIFPSITFAAQAAAVTGSLPNRNGIPGIRWFDRVRVANRSYAGVGAVMLDADLETDCRTIFEYARNGERTVSIVLQPARGSPRTPPLSWEDHWRGWLLAREYESDSPPAISGIWFTSGDYPAHEHGGRSPEVRARLKEMDRAMGRVVETLDRRGLLATTAFGLFSDHGHHDIATHHDLWENLRTIGFTPRRILLYNARMNLGGYFDCVAWIGGDGYANVWVPRAVTGAASGRPDWGPRPSEANLRAYSIRGETVDLPRAVAALPGVRWVAYRASPTEVAVVSDSGEARISSDRAAGSKTSLSYAYRVARGEDPLDYGALADDRPRTAEAWLAATADSTSPDGPVGLAALLDGPRAPDLFVAAEPHVEIAQSPHHSRHGGITREEMRVPVFVAGAGVERGRIPHGRTIDLVPTLLRAMGRGEDFDGDGTARGSSGAGGGGRN